MMGGRGGREGESGRGGKSEPHSQQRAETRERVAATSASISTPWSPIGFQERLSNEQRGRECEEAMWRQRGRATRLDLLEAGVIPDAGGDGSDALLPHAARS